MNYEHWFNEWLRMELDQIIIREQILASCKTQAEKDKYLDRWTIMDAADKVASAIRNQPRDSSFFGLF